MGSMYVAWWNVENLFDEENSPRRSEKLQRAVGKSLAGWTAALRDRKVERLASVIALMNGGSGPDLLGVCEVENEFVLTLLADAVRARLGRTYRVAHADTIDQRGIDVAFLYDPAVFTVPPGELFQHVVMRRTGTRELLQVNFAVGGRTLAVFGNHWPSRSGGRWESAAYRATAGETLAFFHERVLEVHGADTPVLAMGDFNDEPFDVSLVTHALSTRQSRKVTRAVNPLLWNLMWDVMGGGDKPDGTFYFDNQPNMLDQFLVNKAMAKVDGALRVLPETVEILRFPGTASAGDYPYPIPYGGMGKPVNPAGFSDHFPIGVTVVEAA